MPKRLITPIPQEAPSLDEGWLDLDGAAVVEVTSEEKEYPVESALVSGEMRGWRAAVLAADSSGGRKPAIDVNDLIVLTIEAKRKRCGGEVHLVVPPNSASVSPRHPKSSLIKAIARAHRLVRKGGSGRRPRHEIAGPTGGTDGTLCRQGLRVRAPRSRYHRIDS